MAKPRLESLLRLAKRRGWHIEIARDGEACIENRATHENLWDYIGRASTLYAALLAAKKAEAGE